MSEPLSLFDAAHAVPRRPELESLVATPLQVVPRERFLTGLLATWLAGGGKPTKEQRERAERAARAALEALRED